MDVVPAPSQQSFSSTWAKAHIGVKRYLSILRKRWWIVLLTVSIGLAGAAWYVAQMPPAYLSVGRLMVSGQIRLTEGAVYSEELVNFFGTQLELMQSGEVQMRALDRVRALHPELKPEKVKLEVGQLPRASIFIMRAIGETPLFTQAYLDACMEEYINSKKEMRSAKSESTTAALADELVRLEKQLQQEEEEMLQFQQTNNIGFLKEEGNSAGAYLAQINRQLADLRTEHDLLKLLDLDQNLDREKTSATSPSGRQDSTLSGFGPLAEYQKARQQMEMLKAEKAELSRNLKPSHPMIVAIEEQLSKGEKLVETFRDQSVETLKTRRESIRLQIENLEGVAKEWDAKALDLSRRIAEFEKLKSKAERTKGQYDRILTNLRNIDVTKNVDQDTVSILEKASPPMSVKPGLLKILGIGFGLGLLIGLGILFVLDKLDDRISSFIEFRAHFPEHLLGQIPHEAGPGGLPLLHHDDERHALLESFRTLRSSILFLPVEGARPKTFMITSAVPGEGKTTVASNFAITLAFSGARTLLVDADLRRGRLHDAFELGENHGGFSRVLQAKTPWKQAVLQTGITNLSIIPRGKPLPHPAEHLLGKVTEQFLREVYAEYDYIIFDSAPVLVADDALSLAPKIDATLFVVRFNSSSTRLSRRALELLNHRQVNVLGLVCNDVKLSESEYGYGYYYQYSEHYKEARAGT
jgi:succinoglycan biosynthesis transport protein ExoP